MSLFEIANPYLFGEWMYIFLDESGDLGFDFSKAKTTRKFVITLLVCDSQQTLKNFQKAVRRTLKNKLNRRKPASLRINELKGTGTEISVKQYFYRQTGNTNWGIYTVALNKERVNTDLQTKKGKSKLN